MLIGEQYSLGVAHTHMGKRGGRTFECPCCMEERAVVRTQYRFPHLICNACHSKWRKQGKGTCPTCRSPAKHPPPPKLEFPALALQVGNRIFYFPGTEVQEIRNRLVSQGTMEQVLNVLRTRVEAGARM